MTSGKKCFNYCDMVRFICILIYIYIYIYIYIRQTILYRGPKIYNSVPKEIKSLNNPESFKYNLKKSLLLQYV